MLKQQEVVGTFNAKDYQDERFCKGKRCGREIPVSMVYKKDFPKKDGNVLCCLRIWFWWSQHGSLF